MTPEETQLNHPVMRGAKDLAGWAQTTPLFVPLQFEIENALGHGLPHCFW